MHVPLAQAVADGLSAIKHAERVMTQYDNADAEQLAASYDYDVEALQFQWERRQFGSFSTTLDGNEQQRDRYKRAFVIAVARREAAKQERRNRAADELLEDIRVLSKCLYGV